MEIVKTYHIDATTTRVWEALTDPEVIEAWGGGPAVMSAMPGSAFSLWGGDIHGTVTDAIPQRRLVEDWYGGDWAEPSVVDFQIDAEGNSRTVLTLTHTGVPEDETASFDAGWDDYYLGPMKALLEG